MGREQGRQQIPGSIIRHGSKEYSVRATYQSSVTDKLSCQPKERLLEVVVGLGGDIVVLKVLLSVECDGLGLDLSLLHINLVTGKNDWDVLADTDQVT